MVTGHEALEGRISYRFSDPRILERALTRKAFAIEQAQRGTPCEDQEVMRTLGDAVIRLVLVESLIAAGYETRGSISQRKSELEAEGCLASIARRIRLSTYVRFGAGERLQGAADNDYVLAESLEALIGAVYLDGGIIAASRVLKGLYADALR